MKRYEFTLSFDVKEVLEDGEKKDFSSANVVWNELPYEGVLSLEQVVLDALGSTHALGALTVGDDGYANVSALAAKAIANGRK